MFSWFCSPVLEYARTGTVLKRDDGLKYFAKLWHYEDGVMKARHNVLAAGYRAGFSSKSGLFLSYLKLQNTQVKPTETSSVALSAESCTHPRGMYTINRVSGRNHFAPLSSRYPRSHNRPSSKVPAEAKLYNKENSSN